MSTTSKPCCPAPFLAVMLIGFSFCTAAVAEAPQSQCASLRLVNRTDRPIYVYLDGRYITRCESGSKVIVECARLGSIIGTGRYRCDTWGPRQLTMSAGRLTEWVFEDRAGADFSPDQD